MQVPAVGHEAPLTSLARVRKTGHCFRRRAVRCPERAPVLRILRRCKVLRYAMGSVESWRAVAVNESCLRLIRRSDVVLTRQPLTPTVAIAPAGYVLLLELNLPDHPGPWLAELTRRDPIGSVLPILLMTSLGRRVADRVGPGFIDRISPKP